MAGSLGFPVERWVADRGIGSRCQQPRWPLQLLYVIVRQLEDGHRGCYDTMSGWRRWPVPHHASGLCSSLVLEARA